MNYLMLVNKDNGLDEKYIPENLIKVTTKTGGNKLIYLEKTTYKQIKKLLKDMNNNFETEMVIDSGYRTYMYQEHLMNELLYKKGNDAYKSLALPGHSEHQTGLAVDIGFYKNDVYDDNFDHLLYQEEFKWLQENAYKYGFIIRYPLGKEHITGYIHEPWHLRYVGDVAKLLMKYNLTLEEYYHRFVSI